MSTRKEIKIGPASGPARVVRFTMGSWLPTVMIEDSTRRSVLLDLDEARDLFAALRQLDNEGLLDP